MANQKLLTDKEGEVLELTEADFKSALPFSTLPELLQKKLGVQNPQMGQTTELITLRLSQDVVERFRATGEDWQALMDTALKDWLNTHALEHEG